MLLAVGAVQLRVALPCVVDEPEPPEEPEPEPEPEPEEPVLLVDPELPVEPLVLDPDAEFDGLEALAAGVDPEPEPPPHPERMRAAAETAQNNFSAFSDGKRTPPKRPCCQGGKRPSQSASDS